MDLSYDEIQNEINNPISGELQDKECVPTDQTPDVF